MKATIKNGIVRIDWKQFANLNDENTTKSALNKKRKFRYKLQLTPIQAKARAKAKRASKARARMYKSA